jgi:D-arabinose 1-dehydrogenase-like Zn-dependent alcohol dehydrogenase
MAKRRVVQVPRPNGPLDLVEREIPEPEAGTVRIKSQTCGFCHSDSFDHRELTILLPRERGRVLSHP